MPGMSLFDSSVGTLYTYVIGVGGTNFLVLTIVYRSSIMTTKPTIITSSR